VRRFSTVQGVLKIVQLCGTERVFGGGLEEALVELSKADHSRRRGERGEDCKVSAELEGKVDERFCAPDRFGWPAPSGQR
jgi:hypothetical protein